MRSLVVHVSALVAVLTGLVGASSAVARTTTVPQPGIWATDPGIGGRQAIFVVGSVGGAAVVEDAITVCGSGDTTGVGTSAVYSSSQLAPASRTDLRNDLIRFRLDRRGHFGGWISGVADGTMTVVHVPHGYEVERTGSSVYPSLIGGDLRARSGRVQVNWPPGRFGGSGQCAGPTLATTEAAHLTALTPHPPGVFTVTTATFPIMVGEIGVYAAGAVMQFWSLLQPPGVATPSPVDPEPAPFVATCEIVGIADPIVENAQGGYTATNARPPTLREPIDRKTISLSYASPTGLSGTVSGEHVGADSDGAIKTCVYAIPFTASLAPASPPTPSLDPTRSGTAMPATVRAPGTPPSSSCRLVHHRITISFSKHRYPRSALHIRRAVASGWPVTLVLARPGAAARHRRAQGGRNVPAGQSRAEYPPAILRGRGRGLERGTRPTGWMASIMLIPRDDARGAASVIARKLRPYCNGQKVRLTGD